MITRAMLAQMSHAFYRKKNSTSLFIIRFVAPGELATSV